MLSTKMDTFLDVIHKRRDSGMLPPQSPSSPGAAHYVDGDGATHIRESADTDPPQLSNSLLVSPVSESRGLDAVLTEVTTLTQALAMFSEKSGTLLERSHGGDDTEEQEVLDSSAGKIGENQEEPKTESRGDVPRTSSTSDESSIVEEESSPEVGASSPPRLEKPAFRGNLQLLLEEDCDVRFGSDGGSEADVFHPDGTEIFYHQEEYFPPPDSYPDSDVENGGGSPRPTDGPAGPETSSQNPRRGRCVAENERELSDSFTRALGPPPSRPVGCLSVQCAVLPEEPPGCQDHDQQREELKKNSVQLPESPVPRKKQVRVRSRPVSTGSTPSPRSPMVAKVSGCSLETLSPAENSISYYVSGPYRRAGSAGEESTDSSRGGDEMGSRREAGLSPPASFRDVRDEGGCAGEVAGTGFCEFLGI